MRIDHIQLAAPPDCEEAARAFFVDLLGMRELPKPPALQGKGGCWFRLDDANIHIGVESDFRPAKKAHPAMAIENLDDLAKRFSASGVEIEWDDLIPNVRRFFANDPWGNRLEFIQQ